MQEIQEFLFLLEAWKTAPWTIGKIVFGAVFVFWVFLLVGNLVSLLAARR